MFLDPCWKCPHSEVHWDGMHGLLEVLITHGLLTAALEPFTSGPSKTKSLGIPVRQCALSPICLWWWALGVVWKTHTKWQNKNVQFPGPGDYKQKQNNNNNKTTTTTTRTTNQDIGLSLNLELDWRLVISVVLLLLLSYHHAHSGGAIETSIAITWVPGIGTQFSILRQRSHSPTKSPLQPVT